MRTINVAITTQNFTLQAGTAAGNIQYTLVSDSDPDHFDPRVQAVGLGANVTFDNVPEGSYHVVVIQLDTAGNPLAGTSPIASNIIQVTDTTTIQVPATCTISVAP